MYIMAGVSLLTTICTVSLLSAIRSLLVHVIVSILLSVIVSLLLYQQSPSPFHFLYRSLSSSCNSLPRRVCKSLPYAAVCDSVSPPFCNSLAPTVCISLSCYLSPSSCMQRSPACCMHHSTSSCMHQSPSFCTHQPRPLACTSFPDKCSPADVCKSCEPLHPSTVKAGAHAHP